MTYPSLSSVLSELRGLDTPDVFARELQSNDCFGMAPVPSGAGGSHARARRADGQARRPN